MSFSRTSGLRRAGATVSGQHARILDLYLDARVREFFRLKTPWQRRLWQVGSVFSLREALATRHAIENGLIWKSAWRHVVQSARRNVLGDPLIPEPVRKEFVHTLDGAHDAVELDAPAFEQRLHDLDTGYLGNAARAVAVLRQPVNPPGPEPFARAIAAHLLDAGWSPNYLDRWWKERSVETGGRDSVATIMDEAHQAFSVPPTRFSVLALFHRTHGSQVAAPRRLSHGRARWLEPSDVVKWLDANGSESKHGHEQTLAGGLLVDVQARDPEAAAARAADDVDDFFARAALGLKRAPIGGQRLYPHRDAWVAGVSRPFPLRRRRRVEVPSLRENVAEPTAPAPDEIVAALQLASHLDEGPLAPAAASGWAAVEVLLVEPRDRPKTQAAERLAALVASSFPRAELALLAHRLVERSFEARGGTELRRRLKNCATPWDKARIVCEHITVHDSLPVKHGAERASVERMLRLTRRPGETLEGLRRQVQEALLALYRQRNLALHAGLTRSPQVAAALRVSAPLIGAGLDRVVHAWYHHEVRPLEMSRQAEAWLETRRSSAADSLLDEVLGPSLHRHDVKRRRRGKHRRRVLGSDSRDPTTSAP